MNVLEVNVAPSSTKGHFVVGAEKVINIDEITETYEVSGKSILKSENHTTLEMPVECTIFCQVTYNSKLKKLENARD